MNTVEESAAVIWGMARDLAQPQYSGLCMNSERNIKHIAAVLSAFAAQHAEGCIVVQQVLNAAECRAELVQATAKIKELKGALKQRVGRSRAPKKKRAIPLLSEKVS